MVRVRLFAALREAADTAEADAPGKTVGDVVDALSARFGERFAAVAAVSSFVVNGERAARSTPIAEGDEVALLPPVSGGRSADPELIEQQPPLGLIWTFPTRSDTKYTSGGFVYASHGDASTISWSTAAHASFAAAGSFPWITVAWRIRRSIAGSQKCEVLVTPPLHENRGNMNPEAAWKSAAQPTKPIWIEPEWGYSQRWKYAFPLVISRSVDRYPRPASARTISRPPASANPGAHTVTAAPRVPEAATSSRARARSGRGPGSPIIRIFGVRAVRTMRGEARGQDLTGERPLRLAASTCHHPLPVHRELESLSHAEVIERREHDVDREPPRARRRLVEELTRVARLQLPEPGGRRSFEHVVERSLLRGRDLIVGGHPEPPVDDVRISIGLGRARPLDEPRVPLELDRTVLAGDVRRDPVCARRRERGRTDRGERGPPWDRERGRHRERVEQLGVGLGEMERDRAFGIVGLDPGREVARLWYVDASGRADDLGEVDAQPTLERERPLERQSEVLWSDRRSI